MKLQRYDLAGDYGDDHVPMEHGNWCDGDDVRKLEQSHKELLEALKKALDELGGNDPHDLAYEDSICGYLRAAIAKAEGVTA